MAGVRRRLRDVGKKVSSVLGVPRDESVEPATTLPSEPALDRVQEDPPAVTLTTAPTTAAARLPDPLCAAAVELARQAAVEVAGPSIGAHLGVEAEDDRVVTHSFATSEPGYVGWRWAVTVARAEGIDEVTVDEVVLLPGNGSLLAPAWVPWSERITPGDLTTGDLLPPAADDPRLVPAYADVEADPLPFDLHRELGLGRARVLSADGRADAAERWYDGLAGPDVPIAKAAPGRCGECGFLTPLAGSLGRLFGACANAVAPDDGRVVALTHGCGAHSETVVDVIESSYAGMAVEDDEFDVVDRADMDADEAEVVPPVGVADSTDAGLVPTEPS
ncbi:MAG: DUF3027 domain-containing protein [Mycobacteriales bacterium]